MGDIKNIESNAMTKKRQKIEDASLFACFSLPLSYYCKTSPTVGNRKHFGIFNERKKFSEHHSMKVDICVTLTQRDDDFITR